MNLKPVTGGTALPAVARGGGTFTSGPAAAAGVASEVLLTVHCTAISGTTPTLDASLEQSADGSSWSAVAASAITQLTAAGSRTVAAAVTANYVRVTSTVGGTSPSATYSVGLWIR